MTSLPQILTEPVLSAANHSRPLPIHFCRYPPPAIPKISPAMNVKTHILNRWHTRSLIALGFDLQAPDPSFLFFLFNPEYRRDPPLIPPIGLVTILQWGHLPLLPFLFLNTVTRFAIILTSCNLWLIKMMDFLVPPRLSSSPSNPRSLEEFAKTAIWLASGIKYPRRGIEPLGFQPAVVRPPITAIFYRSD